MERLSVNPPSRIRVIFYDADEETLKVEFEDRSCYQYDGVPEYLFVGLKEAGTKFQFLRDHVWRAGYESRRIS